MQQPKRFDAFLLGPVLVHELLEIPTMSDNANFWIALLDTAESREERLRLWNGYIGRRLSSDTSLTIKSQAHPVQLAIDPPDGKWPELSDTDVGTIETMAAKCGGHPDLNGDFVDLSGHTFHEEADFSGLVLVNSSFRRAKFTRTAHFRNTQFCGTTGFDHAKFERQSFFDGARFKGLSHFHGCQFHMGCSFGNATFKTVWFDEAQFSESGFPMNIAPGTLVDFTNVQFTSLVDFREVAFGTIDRNSQRFTWPERVIDFSGARFEARTSFYKAKIAGVPAFFDTSLHEDTDFGSVHWNRVAADRVRPSYAVRAWERLELIMSRLEKPLDRHRFFRFKMRSRRRMDGRLLKVLNWIFEFVSGYGWDVQRALLTWLIHWMGFALVMFLYAACQSAALNWWNLGLAALATGFANAHAFLGLAVDGGYLAASRQLIEHYDLLGLLPVVGTVQAVLGPTLLFLLLLTLRNRFRLA